MKHFLKVSSLMLVILMTSDTQCMLRAIAQQNPRMQHVMLRHQQLRFYNAGHPPYHEDPVVVWNKIEALEKMVQSLKKDVAALQQNQSNMRADVQQVKYDQRRYHHDEINGSSFPGHNTHYGNK